MVGVQCQAVTQLKQLSAGSVLGWVTAGPRPACRNAEREVIFSETVDWGQTLLNGRLYRHRFSAVFLCPRANAIQHRREWLRSHSQGRNLWREEGKRKAETGRKEKGEKGGGDI